MACGHGRQVRRGSICAIVTIALYSLHAPGLWWAVDYQSRSAIARCI